jgi:hypothetical protein
MFARSAFRAAQPLKMVCHWPIPLKRALPWASCTSTVRKLVEEANNAQQARRYATEGAPPKGSNALLYTAIAVGAAAGGYYYFAGGAGPVAKEAEKLKAKVAGEAKKALTGGDQGFVSLKLESVEDVNHNTKIFRFKLPEEDSVSGVFFTSAILTKFQAPGAEKPVVRPYTPISDEGKHLQRERAASAMPAVR